jgi:hypothetical protein
VEFRYAGFEQNHNVRVYKFEYVPEKASVARFVVSVNMELFLKHGITIQEGPTLCARKLSANIEAQYEGEHELTNDDMLAFVADRANKLAIRAESRRSAFQRRPPRPAPFLHPGEKA